MPCSYTLGRVGASQWTEFHNIPHTLGSLATWGLQGKTTVIPAMPPNRATNNQDAALTTVWEMGKVKTANMVIKVMTLSLHLYCMTADHFVLLTQI